MDGQHGGNMWQSCLEALCRPLRGLLTMAGKGTSLSHSEVDSSDGILRCSRGLFGCLTFVWGLTLFPACRNLAKEVGRSDFCQGNAHLATSATRALAGLTPVQACTYTLGQTASIRRAVRCGAKARNALCSVRSDARSPVRSFLLLVAMPFVTSMLLAPSSKARSPK